MVRVTFNVNFRPGVSIRVKVTVWVMIFLGLSSG